MGMTIAALLIVTFHCQTAMCTLPPPTPPPPSNPTNIRFYQTLAQNNILKASTTLSQVNDLLTQAKAKGTDTSRYEKLINETKDLLEQAKKSITNPIYANNLALKAIKIFTGAIECLKG